MRFRCAGRRARGRMRTVRAHLGSAPNGALVRRCAPSRPSSGCGKRRVRARTPTAVTAADLRARSCLQGASRAASRSARPLPL